MERKSKIIISILIILVVCGAVATIFLTPSTIENNGSKNITDMANRSVQIPASVNHIASTSPSMTTIVYMIAPEKLVGLNFAWNKYEEKYVPSRYRNLPVIGGWFGSQTGTYEEFIASGPDIIVDSVNKHGSNISDVLEHQEKFGELPVVAVENSNKLLNMSDSILFLGEVVGAEDKAKELSDFNEKYLSLVHEKAGDISDKKSVYYAEGKDGLQTVPSGATQGQQIKLVGAQNVANELNYGNNSAAIQVSIEQVIKWNPDVIITTNPDFYKSVYNDSKWADIDAVKNHEVYLSPQSPFKWFGRPAGANLIIGLPWTAKVIYPEEFDNLNMVEITQEFYSNFYHVDLSQKEAKQMLLDSGLKDKNL